MRNIFKECINNAKLIKDEWGKTEAILFVIIAFPIGFIAYCVGYLRGMYEQLTSR